ncbi:sensor domain-containing protein [Actinacidiphila paucisporea]|uniref:PknH-like extracellular domain-containing protein n=1 Tax=Actinacidiphila paucisporea TaxID=310782 RepID=A0A1M7F2W9_9ACTN|nr:sensor domain-containing protein [Actinacidiphila paucisporea]SHL98340.1 PknH-like extracellular domain-containing protein [Actinacidiphila paucisporea]
MHKTRLRLAAAALPALLLAAACSSSSDSTKGPDGTSTILSGKAPLTTAQLSKALVTDSDVPGWTIQPSQTADSSDTSRLTADKPVCQPLADITSSNPRIHRMAFVGAAFAKTTATSGATPEVINQMLVASHAPGDAKKVIESVKTALAGCTGFTATDSTGTKTPFTVSKGPAVPTGDESVSYQMNDAADKKTGAALVAVVQTGDTVTAYVSVKSSGGAGPLPIDVVRKQSEKLKAALAARK